MPRLPEGLTPLGYRDFGIYWAAQLTSNVGTQMEATATAWLLYRLTDSPAYLGLAGLARAIPIILFTLFAGTLSDRFGQRIILYITQAAFAVVSLVTGTLVLTGQIQPWELIVNAALNATVLAFDAPARQSLYPNLIPRSELRKAVPLNSGIRYLAIVAGPAVGGFVIAFFGPTPVYFFNALTYAALLVALPFLNIRPSDRLAHGSFLHQTSEGLRYVIRTPLLASSIGLLLVLGLFSHNPSLLTIYSSDVLNVGAEGLGLLLSAVGAGAVVGGVLLVTVIARVRQLGVLFLAAALVYTLALGGFGVSRSFAISLATCFVMGLCQSAWGSLGNTMVQLVAPVNLRGRVLAVHVLVTRAFDFLSGFQSGMLVALFTPVPAVLIACLIMTATLVSVALRITSLRSFRLPVGGTEAEA